MFPEFCISERYRATYPGVGFGLTLISGCRNHENPPGFDQHKRKLLRAMRKRETLAEITARIGTYADFFQMFGFECPLTQHLKRTINSGFPRYDLIVDAHFMAEMCAGILVAVTDYDRFDGNLTLDTDRNADFQRRLGGFHDFIRQGAAIGIAKDQAFRSGFRRGFERFNRIHRVRFIPIEVVFRVHEDPYPLAAEIFHGIVDHSQIFIQGRPENARYLEV